MVSCAAFMWILRAAGKSGSSNSGHKHNAHMSISVGATRNDTSCPSIPTLISQAAGVGAGQFTSSLTTSSTVIRREAGLSGPQSGSMNPW